MVYIEGNRASQNLSNIVETKSLFKKTGVFIKILNAFISPFLKVNKSVINPTLILPQAYALGFYRVKDQEEQTILHRVP